MKNFHIARKIPPDHYAALQLIQNATGQTQSEVLMVEPVTTLTAAEIA